MKKYLIGGRGFELRPLILLQRKLAAPVWKKILDALKEVKPVDDVETKNTSEAISILLTFDEIVFAEDDLFQKFLATILTPSDAPKWIESMIDANTPVMLEIDEVMLAEVLQDFLLRLRNWKKDSSG
jgi:hypothetical protein